jgi:hypothetical protein
MSTKPKLIKYLVALYISKQTPTQLIASARHIVNMMNGNSNFPSPAPALIDITNQALALEHAYDRALTRVKGAHADMLTERKKLQSLLKTLSAYVEAIADANQSAGGKIIVSAGMAERKPRTNTVKALTASAGKFVGSVFLQHPTVQGATIVYQMSTDPKNPASWVQIYNDRRTRFTMTGLTAGTRYYFRAAVIVKQVQSAFSPVVDLVVQ